MEKKVTDNKLVDVFTKEDMIPGCGLPNQLLLFDNLNSSDPLLPLTGIDSHKLFQMTIYFVLKGTTKLRVNNNEVIIKEGQIFVTHEDCIVRFIEASEDIKFFMYVIYPKTVNELFSDIHLNYNKSKYSYSYEVGDVSEADMKYFLKMYEDTKTDLYRPEYKYQLCYARAFLNIILVYISNKFYDNADMQADPSSRQYDMFCKFMDALNQHADKERSVQFYAKLLGITSKYLSFVCLQYSQKNASSWIDEYVVAKARALQNVHHYNIKRISQELNFISPSSFTRFFKRVTGVPPTK